MISGQRATTTTITSTILLLVHCGNMYRLRNERLKIKRVEHGGPNEYSTLRCHNLGATPQPVAPERPLKSHDIDDYLKDEIFEVED